MRPPRTRTVYLMMAVVGLCWGGFKIAQPWRALAKLDRAIALYVDRARAIVPGLLQDQASLERSEFFRASRSREDAGPYLNPRLEWEAGLEDPPTPTLVLPAPLQAKLDLWERTEGEWTKHAADPDVAKADLAWMGGLRRFGYWELLDGGPLPSFPHHELARLPLPIFPYRWAQLRLLRGRATGDWRSASEEVRQLAWLSYSTETLLGENGAVALLRLERVAHDAFAGQGMEVRGWEAWPEEEIQRLERAVWGAYALSSPAIPDALMEEALRSPVGRCAAIDGRAEVVRLSGLCGLPPKALYRRELATPTPPCRAILGRWLLERPAADAPDSLEAALLRPKITWQNWNAALFTRLFPAKAFRIVLGLTLDATALVRATPRPQGAPAAP